MQDIVRQRFARAADRHGKSLCSICSANPFVIDAGLEYGEEIDDLVLIEATCNQVNQDGGYTGMRPADFVNFVRERASDIDVPFSRVVLGGDHLGPHPWRRASAEVAMDRAKALVAEYVANGFRKIHLDASMALGDDADDAHEGCENVAIAPELAAERSAQLCAAAESSVPKGEALPLYVIGTEVPVPGGPQTEEGAPTVTRVADMEATLDLTRKAFISRGLASAWDRVIALVVQPGVEFGDTKVHSYDRAKAASLSAALANHPGLVFEGHSTDYQHPNDLRDMAEDGVAILKVGPALTFAFREAVFLLSKIEEEVFGEGSGNQLPSHVPAVLEQVMISNPTHWVGYYRGQGQARRLQFKYSLSDRCRYYWPAPDMRAALKTLELNLVSAEFPDALISQYLPRQYWKIREGRLAKGPSDLIRDRIKDVLATYPQYALASRETV